MVYGDTFPMVIDEEEIYLRQQQHSNEARDLNDSNKLLLFPNPAKDGVEMKMSNSKENIEHVVIFNSLGNEVMLHTNAINDKSVRINNLNLPAGLYLVKVSTTRNTTFSNNLMIIT